MTGFESWIDRQIREAQERGAFDNLPGAGKPIKGLRNPPEENWWVKGLLERENLRPVLPTTLSLRKETAQVQERVAQERTEQAVREVVADLNARIRDSYRRPVDGPPVPLHTVDVEAVVTRWRERRRRGGE